MSNGLVWTNRAFPLKISGGKALIDPTEVNQLAPKFILWAPHVNGGVSVSAPSPNSELVRPTLDVSFSGYGITKNDLSWKFMHFGFNTDSRVKSLNLHIIPASYRFLPSIFTNTYIGPGLGLSEAGFNGQININVTL